MVPSQLCEDTESSGAAAEWTLLYLWDDFCPLCHRHDGRRGTIRHGWSTWEHGRCCWILGVVVQTGAAVWQHDDSSAFISAPSAQTSRSHINISVVVVGVIVVVPVLSLFRVRSSSGSKMKNTRSWSSCFITSSLSISEASCSERKLELHIYKSELKAQVLWYSIFLIISTTHEVTQGT